MELKDENTGTTELLSAGCRTCICCNSMLAGTKHTLTGTEETGWYCETCGKDVEAVNDANRMFDWCGLYGHFYSKITEATEVMPAGCEEPYQWIVYCKLCKDVNYVPVTAENLPADFSGGEDFIKKCVPQGHMIQWTLRYVPQGGNEFVEVDPTGMSFLESELDESLYPDITLTGTCVNKNAMTGDVCGSTDSYSISEAKADGGYFILDGQGNFSFDAEKKNVFLEH